ncbi:MAG TPA: LamG-like jellyroll fold domain-containing protein [Jatrophihabitans sp.]|nr:LamG-like jellyroll fold domain-containing protein [Jatrophihabitans sp.]
MIRPDQLVSLSGLLATRQPALDEPALDEQALDEQATRQPAPDARSGWPVLLASSAARAVLVLLASLLLAATVPALAGWQPTVVQTGSMQPLLRPGDVVIARPVPAARLRPGQVLLVTDPDQPGRLRLHRLVRIEPDGSLVLRGDANPAPDSSPVAQTALHGVAVLRVPAIGLPMLWLRQGRYLPAGMLGLLLAALFLLAIAYRPDAPIARHRPARRSGRRLGRPAAAVVLTGLAALQLARPAPAQAMFSRSTGTADSWAAVAYFSCRQAVLANSPVLYYQLDETNGRSLSDSSGAGATGSSTPNGITRGQPGTCSYDGGTAMTLNGSSGYLYRTSQSTAPSTFSWEIWFATSTTKGGWLVGMGSSQTGQSSTTDRQLYLTDSGQVGFGISSGGVKRSVFSSAGYNDGNWHLADATFSAGTGMQLYLDGQLVASNPAVTSAQSYSGYLRIGYDNLTGWSNAPTSQYFGGTVDEISAYSTVLTATQIGYHYWAGN